MSELDLLADCLKDATKERDDLTIALEQECEDNRFLTCTVSDQLKRIEQLEAAQARREPLADGHEHLTVTNEFQSDKYLWCPAGFVPLKVTDPMAKNVLRDYAILRRSVDNEFSKDLLEALFYAKPHGGDRQ